MRVFPSTALLLRPPLLTLALRPPHVRWVAHATPTRVTAFFDGSCPVCSREIALLKTLRNAPAVDFVDAAAPSFTPPPGLSHDKLLGEMHVRGADGVVHTRVAAFRELYRALGLNWILAWTATPPFDALAERGYAWVLRHRPKLQQLLR